VRLGLEADYAEGREDELDRWLSRARWDLVLGSVHRVAGGWIDDPGTSPLRFATEGAERLYDEYYRLLARAARTGFFDVLAHFDLPKKFGHRPEKPRVDAERQAIDATKDAGCAVEISSAGLRKPVAEAYPEPRLLRQIVAAGIPITFSSDAHAPAEVGWGFERTLQLARDAGAGEFVTFAKRRRTAHPLP
jgi:histidinol-phosphatase (PHP family)